MLCARTGEFLYEPTHPRLDQIRLYVLKKWTWINGRVDLPEAHTLFHLHFVVAQQPIDDFMCLGELTLGRSLDIMCVVKSPQKPDIRHRKSLEDAIGHHQRKRLWVLLNRYCLPSLLCDRPGELVNPLMLALQSTSPRTELMDEGPSPLATLLDAKCDPNVLGIAQQSPFIRWDHRTTTRSKSSSSPELM